MNDLAPPADATATAETGGAPDAGAQAAAQAGSQAEGQAAAQPAGAVPTQPAAGAAGPADAQASGQASGQAGAAAPAQTAPAQAAGGAHDVPAITDYLPVLLAATSGLLKAASAIKQQVDEDQEVPAFYLDMAGNFLGMLGIMAEAYRRNTRRGNEQAGAGGRALPDPGDMV